MKEAYYVPCCLFHSSDMEEAATLDKYFERSKTIIDRAIRNGRKISCILAEPIFTFHSVVVPDSAYLNRICG